MDDDAGTGSWPTPLSNAVRASNKYLLNPLMVQLAGHKHWYAAAISTPGAAPASSTPRRS
jgi:hypothetical protein